MKNECWSFIDGKRDVESSVSFTLDENGSETDALLISNWFRMEMCRKTLMEEILIKVLIDSTETSFYEWVNDVWRN